MAFSHLDLRDAESPAQSVQKMAPLPNDSESDGASEKASVERVEASILSKFTYADQRKVLRRGELVRRGDSNFSTDASRFAVDWALLPILIAAYLIKNLDVNVRAINTGQPWLCG